MDMGSHVAGRMLAIKLVHLNGVGPGNSDVGSWLASDKHLAGGQFGKDLKAFLERLAVFANDDRRVRCQRVGIHDRHEN